MPYQKAFVCRTKLDNIWIAVTYKPMLLIAQKKTSKDPDSIYKKVNDSFKMY